MKIDPQAGKQMLNSLLSPWHKAVDNPAQAQEALLHSLLLDYGQTRYGRDRGVQQIETINDYRRAFPIKTYEEYQPLIEQVMAGDIDLLLKEPPVGWAITRGTTKGQSKFIPMTESDLRQRISAGRAMMNYVLQTEKFDLFEGVNLNLNFPSVVGTLQVGDQEIEYGYSSGIYARHVSKFTPIESVPSQEEIDALGGSKTLSAWAKRFELALQLCRNKNVTLVGGVLPTALEFGRYLHREHRLYPKDLWQPQIMALGSTPGINTYHRAALQAMYGRAVIREIYGATEGMFGQQRDKKRAWVPNYDLYFLEVQTSKGIKMLHEMKPGQMGKLIVSTLILPRYQIGDIIRAFEPPYFRCIGRDFWWTPLNYAWRELLTLNLGRL